MSKSESANLAQIAQKILEDALHNIVHNIVIHRHHEHKMLLASLDPTTKLQHCPTCKLPRFLEPPLAPKVRGALSDPPANTTYCDRKPWARRAGHDIYGNPFLKSDVPGRPMTKKEREAKKKDDGTPASEDANPDGTGPPSPSGDAEGGGAGNGAGGGGTGAVKLEKGEKKASKIDEKLRKGEYVPWHTCPGCKRSLLITRFAKHLEVCMGLSGRAASRNAMAKMNGSTPGGSRGGTPNPGPDGRDDGSHGGGGGGGGGDDEEDHTGKGTGLKKKVLKKGLKDKVKKEREREREKEKERKEDKDKEKGEGKLVKGAKRPPNHHSQNNQHARSSPAPSSVGGEGKRDRDEMEDGEDEEVHVKKRQKLQRMGSMTSIVSSSTAVPDMERAESNDGSYNEDANFADD